jgi:hypothetical protein
MNLMHFLTSRIPARISGREFWTADQFPLDDEAIADLAVNAMLLVMNNSQRMVNRHHKADITDYVPLVQYGVRFPWKDRISLAAEVDLVNDQLPEMAVIGLTRNERGTFASAAYACQAPDWLTRKHAALTGALRVYRVGRIRGMNPLSRAAANDPTGDIESIVTPWFAGVMPDGRCVGCTTDGQANMLPAFHLAYVVGLHNDRKYFWDVQATEEFWDGYPAKAHFSIDKEYVKSLFYARSVPMTEKGRLRPILHWVKAHQRRLKEGIEIDIEKHLRGIDAFSMHGVKFQINAPRKAQGRKAL